MTALDDESDIMKSFRVQAEKFLEPEMAANETNKAGIISENSNENEPENKTISHLNFNFESNLNVVESDNLNDREFDEKM